MAPRLSGPVGAPIYLLSCRAFDRHMPPTGLFCTVGAYMCSPGVLDVQRQIQFGHGTSQPQFHLAHSGKVRRRLLRLINGGASFGQISSGKREVGPDQTALRPALSHADFEALPLGLDVCEPVTGTGRGAPLSGMPGEMQKLCFDAVGRTDRTG